MQLARRWTSNCLQFHPGCNVERPLSYPSRLLYIAVDPVRLVVTTRWTDRPLYATLSHCWGMAKFETLETANFDELQRGVPDRLLSKTFVHAVQITRAAGFAYLWIDSLCIIQDSNEDWESEASMMASVYGGSSLNIAASSARDGTDGCFLKPLDHAGGFTARICTNGEKEVVDFSPGDEYEKNVTESHLATRAWTVQEKVLPPRTLHCGDQGFFWECRTQIASEYFPDGFCETNLYVHGRSVRWPDTHLMAYWSTLKEWYSSCDLTNPGDKLVALSGVARAIQNKTGDHYFAGLWRQTLERELCWSTLGPRQRPQYRAPSWSWAAVDGPTSFPAVGINKSDICHAHVRSVSATHPGEDTLGAVLHGTLSLHCDSIVCGTVVAEDIARANRRLCPLWHNRNPDQKLGACFSSFGQTGHILPFLLDCAEQKDSRVGQTISHLPLCTVGSGDDSDETELDQVCGLVVEKTNTTFDQYRRIGSFHYWEPGWWHNHDDDSSCFLPKDYFKFRELRTRFSSSGCGGLTINIV